MDPLARQQLERTLEREAARGRRSVAELRRALDDLDAHFAGERDGFDTACNAARILAEVFTRAARVEQLREVFEAVEP